MVSEILQQLGEEHLFCRGVPAYHGLPLLICGIILPKGRARICVECDDAIERRVRAAEAVAAQDNLRHRLRSAGLTGPFVDGVKSLDHVRIESAGHGEVLALAREFALWRQGDGNQRGILLRGKPGLGKTDILEGTIAMLVGEGRVARYVNARDLVLELQGSFREDSPHSTAQILDALTGEAAKFLALDDVGATKTTRFVADALYTLLERRVRNQMPTIIATNYMTGALLAERLRPSDGDALDAVRPVDRIRELCPNVVTLTGVSQRGPAHREMKENV